MKKIVSVIAVLCILSTSLMVCVYAESNALSRVVDGADIISSSDEEMLANEIQKIADEYKFDVVIVTTNSTDGKDIVAFADDFFDYNGYGYNDSKDGILFAIDMNARKWAISTTGYGLEAFTDYGTDFIGAEVVSYLSDGAYATAFERFVSLSGDFLKKAENDAPYDINNQYKSSFFYVLVYGGVIGVSLILTILIMLAMKSKMKTIAPAKAAKNYVKEDSFNLTRQQDVFLYSRVTKTAKPKDNGNSSGGTSSHTSSSGRSHGGSSGSF